MHGCMPGCVIRCSIVFNNEDGSHLTSALEYETLTGEEITNALKGVPPVREEAEAKRPAGPAVSVPISPRPDPEPA